MRRLILPVVMIASVTALAATYENISLQLARTELQLAADGAALAGAAIFAVDPNAQAAARAEAKAYAELNVVRGERVNLAPENIEVIAEEGIIRLTVHATVRPANVLQRVLWLLIGVRESTIEASAAAEARAPDPNRRDRPAKGLKLIE